MRKQAPTNFQHRPLVLFLFYFLLLSYPLLSLLWRRSYPILTAEVGLVILVLSLFCILFVILLGSVPRVIANILSTLLITITLMLQFNLLVPGLILCISLSLVFFWRLRTNFQLFGLPVLIALVLGAYFDSIADDGLIRIGAISPGVNSELPPVVHIILDGFIGVEGLPPNAASAELKSQIYSFFKEYNFQVFPRAYSRFSITRDSLFSAMNFKHDDVIGSGMEVLDRRGYAMKTNAEFDVLEELGYRQNVYQTEYMDFCQSNPDMLARCWQYEHPNVATIKFADNIYLELAMLTKVLIGQSTMLTDLMVSRRLLLDQGIAVHDPRVFTRLQSDLTKKADAQFYFAHVLLPHGPYAFRPDCSVNYDSPVWARYANLKIEPVIKGDIYEIRAMKYFEQVYCALNSLSQLFENMKKNGIFEKSIIVVHGDHGSMIGKYLAKYENIGQLTSTDYRSNFSTLFAVKIPGQAGRVDNRVLSLSLLLETFSKVVEEFVANRETLVHFSQNLPNEPEKVGSYVYLQGAHPQTRVDINIFEDQD
jgi:hypothetical protein